MKSADFFLWCDDAWLYSAGSGDIMVVGCFAVIQLMTSNVIWLSVTSPNDSAVFSSSVFNICVFLREMHSIEHMIFRVRSVFVISQNTSVTPTAIFAWIIQSLSWVTLKCHVFHLKAVILLPPQGHPVFPVYFLLIQICILPPLIKNQCHYKEVKVVTLPSDFLVL